jgi:transcriptional regulator with XRE-family HTH domain
MSINKAQKLRLENLGKRVKSLREAKGLTIKELANSIDKETQSVHRVEKGNVNPSYLYLIQLCEGLDVSLVELLNNL